MKDVLNSKEIQDWLIAQIAELVNLEPETIDVNKTFTEYGLSSLDVVKLSGELEDLIDQRLSPTLAYEYPSIFLLSEHLAADKTANSTSESEPSSKISSNEPIAVIGMGCRFPGAKDLDSYWQLLANGEDKISEVPEDRWPKEAFYHPDPATPGKSISYWGGFLDKIDQFDPFFFGISPNEAKHMDPQQRLLMELSYEALDDAGQNKEDINGSKTGVFIGISINEYSQFQLGNPMKIASHSGTGSALSIAANRISYFLNLRGPSMAIDTACSSSLTAVHLACQSLRNGESKLALAGGVNMILSPAHSIAFTKAGVLSPDGKCKTFDASANGYVRGEGGGVVALKALSEAIADGDRIHAVIPGSAMTQDGRTNGMMAPSQESQENMLREAYHAAGIQSKDVQYVEAHGTGTLLGDSMEASALGSVVGLNRSDGPCAIGSVKTNFGHLEAAAGMAGLIKVILSIKNKTIPPSLHFKTPNPHIPFGELNLHVQNESKSWPSSSNPAIAGVSSFGFGGTNVHVVVRELEQTLEENNEVIETKDSNFYVLPLSANNKENLHSLADNFQNLLSSDSTISTEDICFAAGKRRSQYDLRLAAIGTTRNELSESLSAFIAGEQDPNLIHSGVIAERQQKLAFVFSGQGGQWFGMGRELLQKEPTFHKSIERIDDIIRTNFGWSMMDVLRSDNPESGVNDIDKIQPIIFAIQIALAELWKSWGVRPDAVIGHSMGEVAASYVAGVLSLEDAIKVICVRSQLLTALQGQGSMLATELSPEQAKEVLKGYEDKISIAVINGPTSTVLSGDPVKMEEIMATLDGQDLFCKLVKVDVASHSPQIDQLRPEMLKVLEGIQPQKAKITIYSTVTGKRADDVKFDAAYWVDNLREPVLFSDAIGELLDSKYSSFIEMGPHPILLSSIQQSIQSHHPEISLLPSLRREEGEQEVILRSLGSLYNEGFSIAWDKLYDSPGNHVQLPTITWNRQRYWLETKTAGATKNWQTSSNSHPLLGDRISLANSPDTFIWQMSIDDAVMHLLADHRIGDDIIFPAAGYIELAIQAAKETGLSKSHTFSDFNFKENMILEDGKSKSIQVVLAPDENDGLIFGVYSQNNAEEKWVHNASATFNKADTSSDASACISLDEIKQHSTGQTKATEFYQSLQKRGIDYGPAFSGVEQIWSNETESLGRIRLPESLKFDSDQYQIHPALLDACLQVLAATNRASNNPGLYIPAGCKQIRFFSQPEEIVWSHVTLSPENSPGQDSMEADVRIFGEDNKIIAELIGLRLHRTNRRISNEPAEKDIWQYKLAWQVNNDLIATPKISGEKRNWIIFSDDKGVGEALMSKLEAADDNCQLLHSNDLLKKLDNGITIQQIIEDLLNETPTPIHGIIHLWSLSLPTQSSDVSNTMNSLGCYSVLHLIQALEQRITGSPKLWLVTKGAQSINTDMPVAIEQSPILGLGKVISLELPELKCVRLDLDAQHTNLESADLLFRQISSDSQEDQISFRARDRYVQRLVPVKPKPYRTNVVPIRDNSTYLITGGLGGLGLVTAKWMAQRGAKHLVLMGRSEPSTFAYQVIEEIKELGVEVHVGQADVSDQTQMENLFKEIENQMPALKGVIHAAGVVDDGSLLGLDEERMQYVMTPKISGTWNLHNATASLALDFFVLYSSAVSVLGSPGQGNYAAASSYVDAMAHYRQNLGLPALSINWGPWDEVGLAVEAAENLAEQNASTQHLVKMIKVDRGLEILEQLLEESTAQITVLPFDLKNLIELYPPAACMPFFAEVGGNETHLARLYARPNLKQKYVAPETEIELKMAELWQQTLHIDRVGTHDSFFELGGDSVLAAQILAKARKVYGISINPQDAFQTFTIERLASILEAQIIKQIEEMSEEEVQQRLSDEN